ncbi:MAG: shikimate dehydrogenase [Cyclobacteriaceae bacterium]
MQKFGLVGFPLGHSYSKEFFQKKFEELGLKDHSYELFPMEYLTEFPALWLNHTSLIGVNVTVPHKEKVVRFLDHQDLSVIKVGAANVIMRRKGKLYGYNTDYPSFKKSLSNWIGNFKGEALILGSGGSSKAVAVALEELNIGSYQVSRRKTKGDYTYDQLYKQPDILQRFHLIINATPLGMYPNIDSLPSIPYKHLSKKHHLFDLVYNPEETAFMKKGMEFGAKTKNGFEMLKLQAEHSWDIWTKN